MPISSVRRTLLAVSLSMTAFGGSHLAAEGQTVLYSSRTLFTAAFPGLPTENFEAGNVGSSQILVMPTGTLDKNTNNSFFSTGSILDGLRLSTRNSGGNAGSLDIAGGATSFATGDNTKVIVVNQTSDTLDLNFDNGTTNTVGFDLVTNSNEGNSYTVQVFSGATLLRSDVLLTGVAPVRFLGYSSASVITRVNVNAPVTETVDNVTFGTTASATPEPGNVAFLVGLTGASLCASRRKWIRKSS